MANSEKLTKGLSDKSKKTLIMTIVIALILVCVGGYFVYISGLVPRLLTGAKIVETVDGTQKTIGLPRVLEFWSSLPYWKAFFTSLGYTVVVSRQSDYKLFEAGLHSVPFFQTSHTLLLLFLQDRFFVFRFHRRNKPSVVRLRFGVCRRNELCFQGFRFRSVHL